MAHSWIQSFPTELEAFQVFSRLYPQLCILLVDTYDTLRSGVPHAIHIAKELEAKGFRLKGIRIDSGDLAYLAKKARYMLDREGCSDTAIFVSNQLDEWIIRSLLEQKAPIDGFGVGTRLVTGEGSAALDGVYKLCQIHGMPSMKLSENTVKMTFPGVKKTVRFLDKNGQFFADGIVLDTETRTEQLTHPFFPDKRCEVNGLESHPLFLNIFKNGKRVADFPSLDESAQYAKTRLEKLPEEHKRFENPHAYKVGVSDALLQLIDQCKKSCSQ